MSTVDEARPTQTAEWEQKRRAILDAAAEVFFERGFDRGTTKEIAEHVGLSQPSIYHYVGDKKSLMAEIANQVSDDFTAALDQAEGSSKEPVERLRAVILAFATSLAINRKTFAVYWKELNSIPEDTAKRVKATQLNYVERVQKIVTACQRKGALPKGPPAYVLTEGILGMLSWMHWWYRDGGDLEPADVAAAFSELVGLPRAD